MKVDNKTETRSIHPEVLNDMTLEAAMTMLEVARDLRNGTIKKEQLYMQYYHMDKFRCRIVESMGRLLELSEDCGTAHCICGWMEIKLKTGKDNFIKNYNSIRLRNLFALDYTDYPNDPVAAADAIEKYLFEYHPMPWNKTATQRWNEQIYTPWTERPADL